MKKIFSIFFIIALFFSLAAEAKQPSNTQKKIQPLKKKDLTSALKAGRLRMKMEKLLKV